MMKNHNITSTIKLFIQLHSLLLFIIVISSIPLLNLLTPGLFLGHDTQDHVARIANFYTNLQEGAIIPRWAGNLNWGYGHPILMFLYPLPSYIASYFHYIGLSFIDAVKLVFALAYIVSGLTMYLWISRIFGKQAGFISTLLYQFAPYRFIDLYVRGAIGEHIFFIWPPLVCLGIWNYSRSKSSVWLTLISLSFAGMILSHNALTIMFLPFISLYFIVIFRNNHLSFRDWFHGVLSWIFGFMLAAFFWIPAFFEGKYTLRDVVTKGEIFLRFEHFSRLMYSPWNFNGTGEFSVFLGWVPWLILILTPFILYLSYSREKRNFHEREYLSYKTNLFIGLLAYIFLLFSIILMLPISEPIYRIITLFQKFQFPWRWLSLSIFCIALSGGYIMRLAPRKYLLKLTIILSLLIVIPTYSYWHASIYKQFDEKYFTDIYEGTTDTGESAPIWSVRFMETKPAAYAQTIEGEAKLSTISHSNTFHSYSISVTSETARILENTLYFPGWTLYINNEKQPIETIQFQDRNYHGIMTYYLSKGEYFVSFVFEDTKIRILANSVTIIGAISVVIQLLRVKLKSLLP